MRTWIIGSICLTLVVVPTLHADIYKNNQGAIPEFSDQHTPNSTRIEVPPLQTFDAPDAIAPTPSSSDPAPTPETGVVMYAVAIISPATGATLDPAEWLSITVQTSPDLTNGAGLQLLQDGAPVGSPQSSPEFKIHWLDRGEHHFKVQVVDQQGQVLQESESVTYYQRRPIQNQNR